MANVEKIGFSDFAKEYKKSENRKDFSDISINEKNREIDNITLSNFNFRNATIKNIIFRKVKFNGTNFMETKFENVIFNDCTFDETNFEQALFSNCIFERDSYFLCMEAISKSDFYETKFENCTIKNQKFEKCILDLTDFINCNIERSIFTNEKILSSNFKDCIINTSNFQSVYLGLSCFKDCTIKNSNLSEADLSRTGFVGTTFNNVSTAGAKINLTNFSQTKGLVSPIKFLEDNFEKTKDGYIAYKTFGTFYLESPEWVIREGAVISEVVNFNPTSECGSGVNVATKKWILDRMINDEKFVGATVWKVLIRWEWLVGVCVPYDSDGKIRCERVELIEKYEPDQWGQIKTPNGWHQTEEDEDDDAFII